MKPPVAHSIKPTPVRTASSRRSVKQPQGGLFLDADLAHVATTTPKMPVPKNAQTLTCLARLATWRCCWQCADVSDLAIAVSRGSATLVAVGVHFLPRQAGT